MTSTALSEDNTHKRTGRHEPEHLAELFHYVERSRPTH